jgi:hypothetical protein
MRRAAAWPVVLALCACATGGRAPKVPLTPLAPAHDVIGISALQRGGELEHIFYSGHWEFVSNRKDGRFAGSSARSFHTGDSLTILFRGNRLRIFGITGPNGGRGSVLIAGRKEHIVLFRSRVKQTHKLIFDSGKLRGNLQSAGVVVMAPEPSRSTGYVNIDELEVLSDS